MEDSNSQAAVGLLDCWKRLDLEDALSRISDGAVFRPDCKSDPVVGKEAIRAVWAQYMQAIQSYEYEIKSTAAEGNRVFIERDETLDLGSRELCLPIVAVLEFDQSGKITAWRDYFDTSMIAP
jgi:limonene-1,2-epoxide hydrolase